MEQEWGDVGEDEDPGTGKIRRLAHGPNGQVMSVCSITSSLSRYNVESANLCEYVVALTHKNGEADS
jgi:hypothetical protein